MISNPVGVTIKILADGLPSKIIDVEELDFLRGFKLSKDSFMVQRINRDHKSVCTSGIVSEVRGGRLWEDAPMGVIIEWHASMKTTPMVTQYFHPHPQSLPAIHVSNGGGSRATCRDFGE